MAYRDIPILRQIAANRAARERQGEQQDFMRQQGWSRMGQQILANLASQGAGLGVKYAQEYFPTAEAERETLAGQLAAADAQRAAAEERRRINAYNLAQAKKQADVGKQLADIRFNRMASEPTPQETTTLAPTPGLDISEGLGKAPPGIRPTGIRTGLKRPGILPPTGDVPSDLKLRLSGDEAGMAAMKKRKTGEAGVRSLEAIAERPMTAKERTDWARPDRRAAEFGKGVSLLDQRGGETFKDFSAELARIASGTKPISETVTRIVNKLPARFEKMTDNQKEAYVKDRMTRQDRENAAIKGAAYIAQVIDAVVLTDVPEKYAESTAAYLGDALGLLRGKYGLMKEFGIGKQNRRRGGKGRSKYKVIKYANEINLNSRISALAAINPIIKVGGTWDAKKKAWVKGSWKTMSFDDAWENRTYKALILAGRTINASTGKEVDQASDAVTAQVLLQDRTMAKIVSQRDHRWKVLSWKAVENANKQKTDDLRKAAINVQIKIIEDRIAQSAKGQTAHLDILVNELKAQAQLGRGASIQHVTARLAAINDSRPEGAVPILEVDYKPHKVTPVPVESLIAPEVETAKLLELRDRAARLGFTGKTPEEIRIFRGGLSPGVDLWLTRGITAHLTGEDKTRVFGKKSAGK